MLDTKNVETFVATIPKLPKGFSDETYINLKMRTSKSIRTTTKALTLKGYLGCLPFAHYKNEEHAVIRLLPHQPLNQCTIAYVWNDAIEGRTLAPSVDYFVPALLAQYDFAGPDFEFTTEYRQKVLELAERMGNSEPCIRVINALGELQKISSAVERGPFTLKAANPQDHIIKAIYAAHCIQYEDIIPWLETLPPEVAALQITRRRELTHHIYRKTGVDITERASQLIMGDDVFDPHFSVSRATWNRPHRNTEPLVDVMAFLADNSFTLKKPLDGVPKSIWQAVSTFANDPSSYTGELHFDAADALKDHSPELAYTMLANGASYHARVTKKPPMRAIKQAHQLATDNNWCDIALTLEWALE